MSILKFPPLVFFLFLFLSCFRLTLSASFPLAVKRLPVNGKRISSLVADPPTPPDYHSSLDYTMALIATFSVGTPPQRLEMVMDTGSEISYVTCADGRGDEPLTKSFFNTTKSTSFEKLLCNRPSNCTDEPNPTVGCVNHTCIYSYYFADGTPASGELFKENITLSDSQSPTSLSAISLGCTAKNDTVGADGIMGMNLGSLSLMRQANIQMFSYCVPNHAYNKNPSTAAGTFYLGKNPNSKSFKYVNLSNPTDRPGFDNHAYSVPLTEIIVGGETIQVVDDFDTSSGCPMLIDSGSQYSSLLSTPYGLLREQIKNLTKDFNMSEADVSKPLDMCFNSSTNTTEVAEKIGDVVFGFGDNVTVKISKERLMDYAEDGGSCVGIGQSIDSTSVTNILGIFQQQCHWVEYDSQKRRVGFGEIADCESGNPCG